MADDSHPLHPIVDTLVTVSYSLVAISTGALAAAPNRTMTAAIEARATGGAPRVRSLVLMAGDIDLRRSVHIAPRISGKTCRVVIRERPVQYVRVAIEALRTCVDRWIRGKEPSDSWVVHAPVHVDQPEIIELGVP